jgi:tRNA-dihydrouridine synthase
MLKETVTTVPVLGNGDIWSAEDALRMVEETGCDGVVVGRGCLGRPWLFTDLAAAFAGSSARVTPTLGEVARTLRTHAEYLTDFYGEQERACRDIRKHIAWYLKGFPAGSTIRSSLALVDSLAALDALLASLDPDAPWPGDAAEGQRGRAGSPRRVALPDGWLDSRDLSEEHERTIAEAELSVSGG